MTRSFLSLMVLTILAGGADAHFVWIIPDGANGAKVIFSDDLSPDENVPVEKIAATKLMTRDVGGKTAPLSWKKGEHAYLVGLGAPAPAAIGGICQYGVIQRGDSKPFLLAYYPKMSLGQSKSSTGWDALPLEIVPAGEGRVQVLLAGKPLSGAEVVVLGPSDSKEKLSTDEKGEARIKLAGPGIYGIRAKHVEAKSGEHQGKKYAEVRHFATLVFQLPQKAAAGENAAGVSTLPPLPKAVSSFGAAASDGWVYVYGGHTGKAHTYSVDSVVGTFHRLSLAKPSKWMPLAEGPALQGLALVAHAGKIYRIGGMQPMNKPDEKAEIHSLADCAAYDPATGKWSPIADLPAPRSSHDAVVVGDKIVVVGGWQLNGGGKGSIWHDSALVLDLGSKNPTWEKVPQPFKRRALTAAVHDGKVYVIGGLIGGDKKDVLKQADAQEGKTEKAKVRQTGMGGMTLEVNIFDPATRAWTKGPSMPGPMRNAFSAAACSTGGKLYLSTSDGVLHRLSAKSEAWETVGEVKQRRFVHRLVPAGDNRLLVLGGASNAGPVALTEEIVLTSR